MDKIEFSDVYKFIASVGLVCFGLSFIVPWFVTRNTEVLLLDSVKLNALNKTSQEIIHQQQNYSLQVNTYLPSVSLIFILLGLCLLGFGIVKWYKRQQVVDKIQDETLKSLKMSNMNEEERRNQVAQDIEANIDDDQDVQLELPMTNNQSNADNQPLEPLVISKPFLRMSEERREAEINFHINTENRIFQKLTHLQSEGYDSFQNIKIGKARIKILLSTRDNFKKHIIFEILITHSRVNKNSMKRAVDRLLSSRSEYSKLTNKIPSLVLLIVKAGKNDTSTLEKLMLDLDIAVYRKMKINVKELTLMDLNNMAPADLIS